MILSRAAAMSATSFLRYTGSPASMFPSDAMITMLVTPDLYSGSSAESPITSSFNESPSR